VAKVPSAASSIRLDHRRRGYLVDGELRRGFADDESLSGRARIQIARWAGRFTPEELSGTQRRLLAEPAADRTVRPAQRELRLNQEELRTPELANLYEILGEEERRLVDDPGEEGYPLSTGDLERLTGNTGRQLRKWSDDGVLPGFREGEDRRFWSAALIRAFVMAQASADEKALLGLAARGEAGHFFALMAATLGRAAIDLKVEPDDELRELTARLSRSSRQMVDLDPGGEAVERWRRLLRRRIAERAAKGRAVDVVFSVPRDSGRWAIEVHGGKRALSIHDSRSEAATRAREVAQKRHGLFIELKTDGSVAKEKSYVSVGPMDTGRRSH
jgi:hypothetical protein